MLFAGNPDPSTLTLEGPAVPFVRGFIRRHIGRLDLFLRGLYISVGVQDRVRKRLFNSSFQIPHYRNTHAFHPINYPLCLKPA